MWNLYKSGCSIQIRNENEKHAAYSCNNTYIINPNNNIDLSLFNNTGNWEKKINTMEPFESELPYNEILPQTKVVPKSEL